MRFGDGGYVFHVLNRAVARAALFDQVADYAAFEKVLRQAKDWRPMRLLAYCIMPNHWHLVLWPSNDGDLSEFMRWLTVTHTQRWHAGHRTSGTGALYQGRFKSFPVQADPHLLTVCRYVERNPLRARLVDRAEDWRWSSLGQRGSAAAAGGLDPWPVPVPVDWLDNVNRPETEAELRALRRSVVRGSPWGDARWRQETARLLGLQFTLRRRGRPSRGESGRHAPDQPLLFPDEP